MSDAGAGRRGIVASSQGIGVGCEGLMRYSGDGQIVRFLRSKCKRSRELSRGRDGAREGFELGALGTRMGDATYSWRHPTLVE